MSLITAPVKSNLQSIRSTGDAEGRVPGRLGQIGDSITDSAAYFRNALVWGIDGNETEHDYRKIRSWLAYSGAQPADQHSFYRDHGKGSEWGNSSGWRLSHAVANGHPQACVEIGDGTTPGNFSWALIMFGTNDIDSSSWNPSSWRNNYAAFLQDFIDLGVIPVLSTIPPEADHVGDGRVEEANDEVRSLASDFQIPYVDYYALILFHQPINWHGTLISEDGTHPSASSGGNGFAQSELTETDGYSARSKLTLDMAEKILEIVFDNGDPELNPVAAPVGSVGGVRFLGAAPNPFRSVTTVRFELDRESGASLRIFDAAGRQIRTVRSVAESARGSFCWDGRTDAGRFVSAGVYYYRLDAGDKRATGRVVRLR
jgi:hypothetical protein